MKRVILSASVSAAILFSCSGDPEINNRILANHTPLVQHIFHSDDSLLHGITPGMTIQEVKKLALPTDSLSQEEPGYLLYEGRFDKGKLYTWECSFDSAGLFALTLDIYLTDEESGLEWYKDLTAYFTEKYGPGTDDGMALSWEIKNTKRPFRIELIEDTDYPYGKLTIDCYDLSFFPEPGEMSPTDSLFLPDAL